jgi:ubiquinol-cytochrome c reductase cytochrome c1 subunit
MFRTAFSKKGLIGLGVATTAALTGASVTHSSGQERAYAAVQPWNHKGWLELYDSASLRRGYEVYRQVCSTCHSMEFVTFGDLVGFTHTKEQAKALAASFEIQDGFDATGEPFFRPGKLYDTMPSPYPNIETARFANNGAVPPDLSLIVKARGKGEDTSAGVSHDYVYALLTGFGAEPPEGVNVGPGQHYNPWFAGGVISMAAPLVHEGIQYEDNVIATESQMAKDVSAFLCFTSSPDHDQRKRTGVGAVGLFAIGALAQGWRKRWRWAGQKSMRMTYIN